MVMGKEGQEDFKNRFPERAAKAITEAVSYSKGLWSLVWNIIDQIILIN